MKPKLFIAAAIISLIFAIPLTSALAKQADLLRVEKTKSNDLQIQVKSDAKLKSEQLQQIKQGQQEKLQLQQKNNDLQKQLQTKRDNATRLAAAMQVQRAAKSVVAAVGCEAYRPLVSQYSWNISVAMAVMQAENHSCDPSLDNAGTNRDGTVDYGLFQVNSVHANLVQGNLESLRIPAINVAAAYKVYAASGGWSPWTTFTGGAYTRYLR